jgi:hypothetical protein
MDFDEGLTFALKQARLAGEAAADEVMGRTCDEMQGLAWISTISLTDLAAVVSALGKAARQRIDSRSGEGL